jgi:hypothetical protein
MLSKLDLIGPLSNSSSGLGVYGYVFLPSISLAGENRHLIPQRGIPLSSMAILPITDRSRDADPEETC